MESAELALADSIGLALNHATQEAILERATIPYRARVGWTHSRSFHTRAERVDYECAFICYPSPLVDNTDAARMGWADAARTAGWRAEHQHAVEWA